MVIVPRGAAKVCCRIVQVHDGELEIENARGKDAHSSMYLARGSVDITISRAKIHDLLRLAGTPLKQVVHDRAQAAMFSGIRRDSLAVVR